MIHIIVDGSLESDALREELRELRLAATIIDVERVPNGQEMPVAVIDGEMVCGIEDCIDSVNIQAYLSVVEKREMLL